MRGSSVVLLSGGIDSAVVAALLAPNEEVKALFVDYGQPAASAERSSSTAIARHFGLAYREAAVNGITVPTGGEIPGRNDLLIALAAAVEPNVNIAVGVHGGSDYADCSPEFIENWQVSLDLQHGGTVRVTAPLINLTKADVIALGRDLAVPLALTYSCERSSSPCHSCRSCVDRADVDATY
jgi:7-cyano-7-deazaguanine synthase